MILYAKIRRMYFRDKLFINEIAKRTSLSRNTVKTWLRMPDGSEPWPVHWLKKPAGKGLLHFIREPPDYCRNSPLLKAMADLASY